MNEKKEYRYSFLDRYGLDGPVLMYNPGILIKPMNNKSLLEEVVDLCDEIEEMEKFNELMVDVGGEG